MPAELPPEPIVKTSCLHCEMYPPLGTRAYCLRCQVILDGLNYHFNRLISDGRPPLTAEEAQEEQSYSEKIGLFGARVEQHRIEREQQVLNHVAWEKLRDELSQPLPEPPQGATIGAWLDYIASLRVHKIRVDWETIAAKARFAKSYMKSQDSVRNKGRTRKDE